MTLILSLILLSYNTIFIWFVYTVAMSLLIAAVLFGLGFAYLATQNTTGVTLQAGGYALIGIPLYLVVLGSLLVGLFMAFFMSSVGWISSAMTIRGKENRIRQTEGEADTLRQQIHKLELENSRLKGEHKIVEREDHDDEVVTPRRNFFDRFRNSTVS